MTHGMAVVARLWGMSGAEVLEQLSEAFILLGGIPVDDVGCEVAAAHPLSDLMDGGVEPAAGVVGAVDAPLFGVVGSLDVFEVTPEILAAVGVGLRGAAATQPGGGEKRRSGGGGKRGKIGGGRYL